MKKEYIKPTLFSMNVEAEEMIATSIGLSSDPADVIYVGGGDAIDRNIFLDETLEDW